MPSEAVAELKIRKRGRRAGDPFYLSLKRAGCSLVGLRLKVDGRIFAAAVDFEFEVEAVAFIQGAHAGAFDGADVHERVGLAVVALDEAKALHGVEELDRDAGAFAGELAQIGRPPV